MVLCKCEQFVGVVVIAGAAVAVDVASVVVVMSDK